MRTPLCTLYNVSQSTAKCESKSHSLFDVLSLPLPAPDTLLSEILQMLVSTYLLHAITVTLSANAVSPLLDPSLLSTALQTTPTLLQWLPYLSALPTKHKDSILTRVYSLLTKSFPSATSSAAIAVTLPHVTLSLRTYALKCLLHTSGSLDPNTFWDQVIKFGVSFVKASTTQAQNEEEVIGVVLRAFAELARLAGERENEWRWISGRGFIGFCEYWMGFAKRVSFFGVNYQYVLFPFMHSYYYPCLSRNYRQAT